MLPYCISQHLWQQFLNQSFTPDVSTQNLVLFYCCRRHAFYSFTTNNYGSFGIQGFKSAKIRMDHPKFVLEREEQMIDGAALSATYYESRNSKNPMHFHCVVCCYTTLLERG